MAAVSIKNLGKTFGKTIAVNDFSLDIGEGELMTFLGPSGCGKTTTLRMIAGFIEPTSGAITVGNADITRQPVHKRGMGMVFQRYALFPHMTVQENVAFGLKMHKVRGDEAQQRIIAALEMVRMSHLQDRYPRELSGGQQQRVAIARALVIRPSVFLLDEPLSNLDAKLRVEVRDDIRLLQRQLGLTTIFVTHDQEEALAISDRMAIMHDGRVQQVGTPKQLYEQPGNPFVAGFLGRMNFFSVASHPLHVDHAKSGTIQVGVRPERIRLSAGPIDNFANRLPATIESVAYLGDKIDARLRLDTGMLVSAQTQNQDTSEQSQQVWCEGAKVYAQFHAHDCVSFTE
ncbi:ABC transporter ATP-binding protein [Alcaligenaceae bacterium]|nr:ABC transporter ATP-binding protein [Alcaligenaceae bacterium]